MSASPRLSVCIVTFNEELDLPACLESVRWADEIIVVDSFSTDGTMEIARRYTDKVIQRKWPGYVEQKNFAVSQATGEWVFGLDADERVSPELAEEIKSVVATGGDKVGFTVPRKTWYLGRWITHGGWYPARRVRLARRDKMRWGGMDPHDHMLADGPVGELKGDLYHFTYRDIGDHLSTIDNFTGIAAREMRAGGKGAALLHMLLNPPARFLKMYLLRLGFLDGVPGLIVAVLAAYYAFLKHAKLWELTHVRERP